MKEYYRRIGVFGMTFFLGLTSIWFFHSFDFSRKKAHAKGIENATLITIAPPPPRFVEYARACGFGYFQSYFTDDGIPVGEGNGCREPGKKDRRIVSRDQKHVISKKKDDGKVYADKVYYEIYQVETGHCITAPSVELGLELENFLREKQGY